MPTNYTITYKDDQTRGACAENVSEVTFALVGDGVVEHPPIAPAPRYVDLLTIYYTQDPSTGQYPNPPEQFVVKLSYASGYAVKPIAADPEDHTATIVPDDRPGLWTLTVTGPTNDEVNEFQLNENGETPPQKLKIRVKREPTFSCSNGPFDDEL